MKLAWPSIKIVPAQMYFQTVMNYEAMLIKERLKKDDLDTFTTSNGWLKSSNKHTDCMR